MEGNLTPLTTVHCPLLAGLADPMHIRLEDEMPPIVETNSLQVHRGKPGLGLGLPRWVGEGVAVGDHHQLHSLPDELQEWHVLQLLPLLLHHLLLLRPGLSLLLHNPLRLVHHTLFPGLLLSVLLVPDLDKSAINWPGSPIQNSGYERNIYRSTLLVKINNP